MRIGLDFDNTIVNYDPLFHKVALEQSLVPASTAVSKVAVRDYLRKIGKEAVWTEMQGYVYGSRMGEAEAYPGVIDFIRNAKERGAEVVIVSHKTKYPFLGPKYDLHAAASEWIVKSLGSGETPLLTRAQVFFELTKDEKISRIAACECDYFVDDLPEILEMSAFPSRADRMLFDPELAHQGKRPYKKFGSWEEIKAFFESRWPVQN
jgi:hypothetical protein